MCDYWGDPVLQTSNQHVWHLVPCFIHFSTIDSFHCQSCIQSNQTTWNINIPSYPLRKNIQEILGKDSWILCWINKSRREDTTKPKQFSKFRQVLKSKTQPLKTILSKSIGKAEDGIPRMAILPPQFIEFNIFWRPLQQYKNEIVWKKISTVNSIAKLGINF